MSFKVSPKLVFSILNFNSRFRIVNHEIKSENEKLNSRNGILILNMKLKNWAIWS